MTTQKEYMDFIKSKFYSHIYCNKPILDAYSYRDNRARDCISRFKNSVEQGGLKFSNCYHANGIGNNNDYMIFIETKDQDGFVIRKNIANFYYCYGIYGGCSVMLKDLANEVKYKVGGAR